MTEKPADSEKTREPRSLASRIFWFAPPYLFVCPAFIMPLLWYGWSFSDSIGRACHGDGCIFVGLPFVVGCGVALSFLAIQLLVLIPLHVWLGVRAKRPVALSALTWIAVSLLPFIVVWHWVEAHPNGV